MKIRFLLAVLAAVAVVPQQVSMAFLGPPAGFQLLSDAVSNADSVVAGTVEHCEAITNGVATNCSTVYTGVWMQATVLVDHVLKGGRVAQIRVVYFRPDDGRGDELVFDSVEKGFRYLLFLKSKDSQKGTYAFSATVGSEVQTPSKIPAGISNARNYPEQLECELLAMIESSDPTTRARAINSVRALPFKSPVLLHEVELATQDTNTLVSGVARQAMNLIRSQEKMSPQHP